VDAGGEGAGDGVVDDGDEEEGSQRMVRRFSPWRAKAEGAMFPAREGDGAVVLVAREGDNAAGRWRQKHGRKRFVLSNPTKIVGSESYFPRVGPTAAQVRAECGEGLKTLRLLRL
jgi:hypothetical protein